MNAKEANFYKKKDLKSDYLRKIITIGFVSVVMAFVTNYLIIFIEIYSPGLSGISQGIAYTINDFALPVPNFATKIMLYWITYIIFNIPIIWFSFKFAGKNFTWWSLYSLGVNLSASLFFTYVPGFNEVQFFDKELLDNADELIQFITYIIIGIVSGVIFGVASGVLFKTNASSFGLDPIIRHIARTKQIKISSLIFLLAFGNTIFWVFLQGMLSGEINSFTSFLEIFINPKVFASIIFFILISSVSNTLYSTTSKTVVEINSKKTEEISLHLKNINYHRNHTVFEAKGGYSNKTRKIIQMIVNSEELKDLYQIIQRVDNKAFIFTWEIKNIIGNYNNKPRTFEDIKLAQNEKKKLPKIKSLWNKEALKIDSTSFRENLHNVASIETKKSASFEKMNNKEFSYEITLVEHLDQETNKESFPETSVVENILNEIDLNDVY